MSAERIATLIGEGDSNALAHRADILAMTEAARAAALRPKETGAFSHPRRAALAARIARLNGDEALAAYYGQASTGDEARLADPSYDGGADEQLKTILAFTDCVATSPKDANGDDIESLKKSGLAEADIVRLTQLNAFLAYEIRLIEGLRLMGVST